MKLITVALRVVAFAAIVIGSSAAHPQAAGTTFAPPQMARAVGASQKIAQSPRVVLPVSPVRISAGYFDPNYLSSEHRQHLGIDLSAPVGTRIVAPEEGDVVFSNTNLAGTTVDEAYLVIRTAHGAEHVLGHIVSELRNGTHVVPGQEVGMIREWPGNPGRSHLHWGVNVLGVAQAMRDGWGWGRAPITATEAEASAKGWVNFNSTIAHAADLPIERPNSATNNHCARLVARAWVLVRDRRPISTWEIDFEEVLDCVESDQERARLMDATDAYDPPQ